MAEQQKNNVENQTSFAYVEIPEAVVAGKSNADPKTGYADRLYSEVSSKTRKNRAWRLNFDTKLCFLNFDSVKENFTKKSWHQKVSKKT